MENWEEMDGRTRDPSRRRSHMEGAELMLVVAMVLSCRQTHCEVCPTQQRYMHGGVSFEPHRAEFDALIGGRRLSIV